MITLAIDASTYVGSVAVLDGSRVVIEEATAMRDARHERLMPTVDGVLRRAGVSVVGVDRVVCGAGPGSFTSLRIAGGIAKGIAAGASVPLYAVPSLALLVAATRRDGEYLAAIDALRGECYAALYDIRDGKILEVEPAHLVPAVDVPSLTARSRRTLVSAIPTLGGITASPSAGGVGMLEDYLVAQGPTTLGAWEPAYGRLAEAQVKWESAHGRALPTS